MKCKEIAKKIIEKILDETEIVNLCEYCFNSCDVYPEIDEKKYPEVVRWICEMIEDGVGKN